ncbi:MAG: DUF1850 domain-containing protein [Nitrososphaerota archaeon]|nr:DUF1850 domain-containing protein [Nitrososphaerales archaeon]MDW8044214.1 DUF1850 domain-containing protein [Nitrososphaerota archaeon]
MGWKKNLSIYLTLILLLLLTSYLAYPVRMLEVRNLSKGRLILSIPVSPGETFTVSFIHSLERTPVKDLFIVQEDNRLRIFESHFKSCYSAHYSDGGILIKEGGWFIMKNITRPAMDKLLLIVASINNYTISTAGFNVSLNLHSDDGDLVEIKVIVRPALFHIFSHQKVLTLRCMMHGEPNISQYLNTLKV